MPPAPKVIALDYTPQEKQRLFHETPARLILFGGAAGPGKLLDLETPIPTPSGFRRLAEVGPGDLIFGRDGLAYQVLAESEVVTVGGYRLRFDDGAEIVAHDEHLWLTFDAGDLAALTRRDDAWRAARRAKRPSRALGRRTAAFTAAVTVRNKALPPPRSPAPTGTARTTAEIVATLRTPKGRANHAIPVAGPLDLARKVLPLDPYVLGVWLGDGTTANGTITTADPEVTTALEASGFPVAAVYRKPDNRAATYRHEGLGAVLKTMGLLGDKRIPEDYLWASKDQRLALLQGLMDTDGSAEKGAASFTSTKQGLAEGVAHLARSLGHKAAVREGIAKLNGRTIGPKWTVNFAAQMPVFRLPRKLERLTFASRRTTKFRYLTSAERVEPVRMKCLRVSSPDHLFLAGRDLIPTHNSHALRWDLITWCLKVPGIDTYLFRRTYEELYDTHIRRLQVEVPPELGVWIDNKKRFQFNNGSGINCCYLERDADVTRYQGPEIHILAVDETAQMTPFALSYLIGRCRLGSFEERVPEKYRRLLPRVAFASNPGGPSHGWLKERFIDPAPPMTIFEDQDLGWPTVFIPGLMRDNRYLDPNYKKQFSLLPEEMARAFTEGDWDAIVGQALPVSRTRHMLPAFTPPRHWTRFMAMDWGTAKPFSVGWYCVVEGKHEIEHEDGSVTMVAHATKEDGTVINLPSGAVIRYEEWYGWNGKPDTGCRLESPAVARGIVQRERERKESIDYRIADSQMWAQQDGPSPQERMHETEPTLTLRQSVKDRKANYTEFIARLAGEHGLPMFYVTDNCRHFWRTIPGLLLDELDPEKGWGEKQENHVADECAYGLRSRPYVTTREDRREASYRRLERAAAKSGSRYAAA